MYNLKIALDDHTGSENDRVNTEINRALIDMNNINQIAQQFIEGKWLHDKENKILKKTFASERDLNQLGLVNTDGYLESTLKDAIIRYLSKSGLHNVQGYFGDADIFSGDILDDVTLYNIELHHISQDYLDALLKIPHVVIEVE